MNKEINVIVVYKNSKNEILHTWETSLPLEQDMILEAVYSTGLVEDDDVSFVIQPD